MSLPVGGEKWLRKLKTNNPIRKKDKEIKDKDYEAGKDGDKGEMM